MELKVIQRFIRAIEECEGVIQDVEKNQGSYGFYSEAVRAAIVGSMIERKNNLIEQMRNMGVAIEVEV